MSERHEAALRAIGARRRRARARLALIDAELEDAVIAADGILSRSEIVRLTGLARETVYKWIRRNT